MSNIFTDFVRVYAQPRRHITMVEAQWIAWTLLGPGGSYWVPVHIRCGPEGRYADIQYGSGKSSGIVDFCEDHVGYWRYSTIWCRHFNEGGDQDVIWWEDVNDGPRRFCRYGFDEVRVTTVDGRPPAVPEAPWRRHRDGSWWLEVAGSYRTGNDRSDDVGPCATPTMDPPVPDPAVLPLPTPTTPTVGGEEPTGVDPPWLASLTAGESTAVSVEYHWRGRLVHRASFQVMERYYETTPDWHHRSADHWDNCLDPDFLRFTGATDLLASEEVYERDRRDWEAATWYHHR
ncbi:hypothetical protein GCM10023191_058210 [Actinoallomurus oryzae]|uniref:Uncharacterized protein n=1 Tax=Actinoallomurus oryzae TaxID=502180 RepID=A0ABP8QKX5_9ACTN